MQGMSWFAEARRCALVVALFAVAALVWADAAPAHALNEPTISWVEPASGVTVSGVVTLKASASAVSPDRVTKWCLKRDGVSVLSYSAVFDSSYSGAYYSSFDPVTGCFSSNSLLAGAFRFDTTALQDGAHSFVLTVTDSSGRSATSSALVVSNVNGAPSVGWVEPLSGSTVSGQVTLKATAAPDPTGTARVTKWCLKRDGVSVLSYSAVFDSSYSGAYYSSFDPVTGCFSSNSLLTGAFRFDTSLLSNAAHTFQLTVTDSSGRAASATIALRAQNRKPPASISAGTSHSCARIGDGTVKCWGLNSSGQLGGGSFVSSKVPVSVTSIANVTGIAAGGNFTCAVVSGGVSGTARCWGGNGSGQLGALVGSRSAVPVVVTTATGTAMKGVSQVAAGADFACALLTPGSTGVVRCWGGNAFGQLGDGSRSGRSYARPVLLPTGNQLKGVTSISAGGSSACAVMTTGAVRCWGWNKYGQLGDGTFWDSTTAYPVPAFDGVRFRATLVSVGNGFACARMTSGRAACWGRNNHGQIGEGSTFNQPWPMYVYTPGGSPMTGVTSVAAGGAHACAVLKSVDYSYGDSTYVRCWGSGSDGQLGNGQTFDQHYAVAVKGSLTWGATAVSASGNHTLAMFPANAPVTRVVAAWGANLSGELGHGDSIGRRSPVTISRL